MELPKEDAAHEQASKVMDQLDIQGTFSPETLYKMYRDIERSVGLDNVDSSWKDVTPDATPQEIAVEIVASFLYGQTVIALHQGE